MSDVWAPVAEQPDQPRFPRLPGWAWALIALAAVVAVVLGVGAVVALVRAVSPPPKIGTMFIPRLDLHATIRQGVNSRALSDAVGHYPTTPLPYQPGNVALAGRRFTGSAPFQAIIRLHAGDLIIIDTGATGCSYAVGASTADQPNPRTISDTDISVLAPTKDSRLTLTAPTGAPNTRLVLVLRRVH